MTMSDEQKNLVKRLTRLLKENGSSILTDGAPLCLTVSFLQFINGGFSVLTDDDFGTSFEALPGSSTQIPICQDLQFLYDFMQKTPKLKLIYDSASTNDVISIAAFRSLLELEFKRVPVSMVMGLAKLRQKLKVLVCNRCLQHLEDILEHHDADGSSTLMWTQLTKLSCGYNFLTELDNSLRLLPVVDEIDLSHNSIYDTDSYLEHMTELKSLDISFNLLSVVPSLSISSQNKLKRLSLRHNQLENVEGVQELQNLTDLDLAYNCLSSHQLLRPLRGLEKLQKLLLEGNPLSYHSKHRQLTAKYLSPVAVRQLVLDRRKLTAQEILTVQQNSVIPSPSLLPHQQQSAQARDTSCVAQDLLSLPANDFLDSYDESGNCSAGSLPSSHRSKKPQRKKRQRKPRTVEITDANDTTTEKHHQEAKPTVTQTAAKSFSFQERIDARKEIEIIRSQLGPDWLQTLSTAQETTNHGEPVNEVANQMSAEEKGTATTSASVSLENRGTVVQPGASERVESHSTDLNQADAKASNDNDAGIMTLESLNAVIDAADRTAVSSPNPEDGHLDNMFSWSKTDNTDVDYGSESDPFIVRRPEGGSTEHFLVTIAERYVLEKDIEGRVIEALDQRCLRQVELVTDVETGDANQEETANERTLVRLCFDYYKKEKTERCYVMEDRMSAESLIELLEPSLELRRMSEALQDLLQCLKCNTQFSLSENKRKFAATQTDDVRRCPKCKSDLIIDLDMGQISRSVGKHGTSSLDLQSVGANGMSHKPTAQSTPVRSQDSDRLLYGKTAHESVHSQSVKLESPLKIIRNASSISLDSRVNERSAEVLPAAVGSSVNMQPVLVARTPHRQVSESSDIIVLDEKRQSVTSTSSDIAVLSGGYEAASSALTLSPIRDHPSESLPSAHPPARGRSTEVTPCGSLSENTIHSMVSSIYENTFTNATDSRPFVSVCGSRDDVDSYHSIQSFHSIQDPDMMRSSASGVAPEEPSCSGTSVVDVGVDSDLVKFSFSDFSFIDHRLKLHLSLDIISGDEELCYLLQCGVVSLDNPLEHTAIVVITTYKLYIFHTELPLSAEQLVKSLKLKQSVELSRIEMIVEGFGATSLYLVWEKTGCRLLIRDENRCRDFGRLIADHLHTSCPEAKVSQETITTEQVTSKNVIAEVLGLTDSDTDTDICHCVMCHQQVGALESGEAAMTPVSVFVSTGHIAMVTEDPGYVLEDLCGGRSQSHKTKRSTDTSRRQFEVKDLQKLTDITAIEMPSSNPLAVSLTFSEEDSSEECTWRLTMATTDARETFITIVTRLWEEQFGVEFICKYT